MTVEMAKGLADLQRQILTVVHNYVKPGGKLLYSTCTINREENEDNTAWFVENFPEFEKIREKQMLPGSDMGDGSILLNLENNRLEQGHGEKRHRIL